MKITFDLIIVGKKRKHHWIQQVLFYINYNKNITKVFTQKNCVNSQNTFFSKNLWNLTPCITQTAELFQKCLFQCEEHIKFKIDSCKSRLNMYGFLFLIHF